MAVQSDVFSDSGPSKFDKPYKCEMFWERFDRRQEPLTRRVYSSLRRNCAEDVLEPLHLEPKNLIMNYLGQADKAPNEKISEVGDDLVHETPPHSSQENEKLVPKWPRSWKREDTILRKHLCRTRFGTTLGQHVLAVKQGRSYFHLLQKEEQEVQEEQRRERQRREELRRTKLRPPTLSDSDEDSDTERWCDNVATSSSDWKPNRRKMRARPFTPIHRSLISTPPHLLPGECVFRQLCCLNWLLEALTLERAGRVGPVNSCWDIRDPGTSRSTIKKLNKEKAIEAKWEQFIAPPKTRHLTSRPLRVSSGRHQTWKTSALSVLSSSVTGSSAGSLLSLAPAPDHTCDEPVYSKGMETLSVRSDSDPSSSEYLQKFLQEVYQSVFITCCNSDNQLTSTSDREMSVKVHPESETQQNTTREKTASQRVQSSPARTSATIQLLHKKEVMLGGKKPSFMDKAEELTLNLSDALDRCAKKRWDFGVQRYRSLCNLLSRGRIRSAVTSKSSVVSPRVTDSNIPDSTEDPYSTQWLSALLSNLAPIKHSDRRVARLLEKLSRFTEGHDLQLHPHNFLKILNSLHPWELCCPDLCVAIEIVRLNVVKMPKAEYDSWLYSRLNQSQTTKSAAHNL